MKTATLSAILTVALGALFLAGCGDSVPNRFGGGTVCASDDPEVGNMLTCPESEQMIDFCVNTGNGNCYYQVGGDRADCGNCLENANLGACAQQAINFCN